MKKHVLVSLTILALMSQAHAAAAQTTDIPPLDESELYCASPDPVVLVAMPNGGGDPLTEAQVYGLGMHLEVDATLTAEILDVNMDPIINYPFEDLWLEGTGGGLTLCNGGTVADANTDANGRTTFTGPFHVGGGMDPTAGDKIVLMVNGSAIWWADAQVYVITPDLNGDLVVDLTDVVTFVDLYWNDPAYHFAVDFCHDGVNNLSDLVVFSGALFTTCP